MSNVFTVTTKPTKTLTIKAAFEKDGITHFITKSGQYKKMPTDEYVQQIFEKNGRGLGVKKFVFKSTYNKSDQSFTNTILMFTEGKKDSIGDHNGQIEWWKIYPGSCVDGHDNSEVINVYVENLSKQVDVKSANFRKRLKVSNIIEAIADGKSGHAELSAILEYFGRNPIALSVDQMVLALIGNEVDKNTGKVQGILMDEADMEDFTKTFMEDANINKEVIIAVNKAINHKVIIQRSAGDNPVKAYYWNDALVGTTVSEVRSYFMSHDNMLKSLSANLDKLTTISGSDDKIIPNDAKSKVATEKSKMIEVLSKAQEDTEKYPELKDINLALMAPKKLKEFYDKITESKS